MSAMLAATLTQDVDGVLNAYIAGTPELDPRLLQNLKQTLAHTGAAARLDKGEAGWSYAVSLLIHANPQNLQPKLPLNR